MILKKSLEIYLKLIIQGAFWKNNAEGFPNLAKFTVCLGKFDM